MENKKLYTKGENLVLVTYDEVTGEEISREEGPKSLMLSNPSVREILLGTVKEETTETEKNETEKNETVDINEAVDSVIDEDQKFNEEGLEDEFDVDLENVPFDDEDVYDEHEITEEHQVEEEKKNKFKKAIATVIVVGIAGLAALGYASCNDKINPDVLKSQVSVTTSVEEEKEDTNDEPENTTDTPDNTVTEPEETVVEEVPVEKTLDELYSDSRYTEVTEENLTKATNDLINEFSKHGIEVNGQDALYFVALNNITHMSQTNPELLNQIFAEVDKETVISKAGHIIGQVVTLEITNKDEQVDWTVALIDEADKKIADHDMKLIESCKEIARNEELTKDEKSEQIQSMIQDKFVKPNYDKTIGRDFEDGKHSSMSQEDGADFTTDAIFTGVMMGDNELKNYVSGTETMDDLMAISGNEDVVPNLFTIIEDCNTKTR